MSRREDRSSDAKRHRSRFDREPSPKRSRRDDKLEPERPPTNTKLDKDRDGDQKHHRRLQDPLPLEAPLAHDSKVESRTVTKESENKTNGPQEGTKISSDPAKVPQSRSYFQVFSRKKRTYLEWSLICLLVISQTLLPGHLVFGSACTMTVVVLGIMEEASFGEQKEYGWWRHSKEQQNGGAEFKTVASDARRNHEKARDGRDDNHVWRHDGFFQMEANQNLLPVKKGLPLESKSGRRDERRPERSFARESNSRDGHGGGGSRYRGRRVTQPGKAIAQLVVAVWRNGSMIFTMRLIESKPEERRSDFKN
ncbi:hypothetical protein DH2020_006514 [Rehmannia glutinosa]|uniref:Uncharacterized protein n=1 Tax=Rehmannia glutinosa TaxID=99300 RepID=A0ABR0XJB3_REHGL